MFALGARKSDTMLNQAEKGQGPRINPPEERRWSGSSAGGWDQDKERCLEVSSGIRSRQMLGHVWILIKGFCFDGCSNALPELVMQLLVQW